MALCSTGHSEKQRSRGFIGCLNQAEPGRVRCRKCLDACAAATRKWAAKRKVTDASRPDWMRDPSLLPKRPPGAK